jgi:hypothetical protein
MGIYSVTGTYMGTTVEALPAGIYIVRKDAGPAEKIVVR